MGKVYTQEERNEAMKLAGEIGNRAAAERLGINLDTLYTWQSKAKAREIKRAEIISAKSPEEYAAENARLKKELTEKENEVTILQEALSFFVKRRKKSPRISLSDISKRSMRRTEQRSISCVGYSV